VSMVMWWHSPPSPDKKFLWPTGFCQTWIAACFAGGYLLTSVPVHIDTLRC
jgi:hypothetical protein